MENWKVQFIQKPDRLGRALYIIRRNHEQRFEVMQSDGKTKVYDLGMSVDPTLWLDDDTFQDLVNAVHKDFKPSEGRFTEGKLEATERHLADLRKLLKL